MRNVGFVLLIALMFTMTPSAEAAHCSVGCENSTLSVSCSGDTCEAGSGQVRCTTTLSCGQNCTMVQTQTVTCGGTPSGPGKTKNPE